MKVVVNKQPQQFFIVADNKWQPVLGHGIEVGKYLLCAIPNKQNLNIFEVTSGRRLVRLPMTNEIMRKTESKEETMRYFQELGEKIATLINAADNFDASLKEYRASAIRELGERPPIKDVDLGAENHT